jgi:hypothetical protein
LAKRRRGACDYAVEFSQTEFDLRKATLISEGCATGSVIKPIELTCERKALATTGSAGLLHEIREKGQPGNGFIDFDQNLPASWSAFAKKQKNAGYCKAEESGSNAEQ